MYDAAGSIEALMKRFEPPISKVAPMHDELQARKTVKKESRSDN